MRIILAIVVISCFFAVATSQLSPECSTRFTDLSSCFTMLRTAQATPGQTPTEFCNECGNSLVSYDRDCAGGVGVDAVQTGIL